MASVTFQLRGSKEMVATLQRMGAEAPKAAAAALFLEGERIMARAKENTPIDMGPLRASGHVQPPEISATAVRMKLGFGGPSAPYALFVHEGTGPAVGRPPYFPPPEAIEGWVRRNLAPKESEVKSLTFVIARAIGQRGTKPTKFLERAIDEARSGFDARVAKSMQAWLSRQGRAAAG